MIRDFIIIFIGFFIGSLLWRLISNHWRHNWAPYETPKLVHENDVATLTQRRECTKCKAVDYRRVMVHN